MGSGTPVHCQSFCRFATTGRPSSIFGKPIQRTNPGPKSTPFSSHSAHLLQRRRRVPPNAAADGRRFTRRPSCDRPIARGPRSARRLRLAIDGKRSTRATHLTDAPRNFTQTASESGRPCACLLLHIAHRHVLSKPFWSFWIAAEVVSKRPGTGGRA